MLSDDAWNLPNPQFHHHQVKPLQQNVKKAGSKKANFALSLKCRRKSFFIPL
jgi:hypothetical protein